jgi:hypothetical protein
MKSQWLTHKNQKIIFLDLSNFKADFTALKAEVDALDSLAAAATPGVAFPLLTLIDLRNTLISPDVNSLIKERIHQATPQTVRKLAVVGLTGIRRAMFDMYVRLLKTEAAPFDDIDKAKDWLVS